MRRSYLLATGLLLVVCQRANCNGVYCLQSLWLEYPGEEGSYYVCQFFEHGCSNPPEEIIWQGNPSGEYEMPEDCDHCEGGSWHGGKVPMHSIELTTKVPIHFAVLTKPKRHLAQSKSKPLQGHGLELTSDDAFSVIEIGLKNAKKKEPDLEWGKPHFFRIPNSKIPAEAKVEGDVDVIAVPMLPDTTKPKRHHITDLCLQLTTVGNKALKPIAIENVRQANGRQLSIKYSDGGEHRQAVVWLK